MKRMVWKKDRMPAVLLLTVLLTAGLTACGAASGEQKNAPAASSAAETVSSTAETASSAAETASSAAEAASSTAEAASSAAETAASVSEDNNTSSSPASAEGGKHHVKISVENYGDVLLELDSAQAPVTVENFMKLAESGFYDGLTFHRIIDGFMIQGGDPLGNGTGGSDQTIKGEFSENGVENTISHKKGVISMARAADPDSASSQFFITVADSTFLDGQYAAFGYVTEGQDVCDKIAAEAEPVDNNGTIPKENQPVITKVEVID